MKNILYIILCYLNKIYIFLILILLFYNIKVIYSINEIDTLRDWCWTSPVLQDDSFILNNNNGGINWGYCKNDFSKFIVKKEYIIYIDTSQLPDSETK